MLAGKKSKKKRKVEPWNDIPDDSASEAASDDGDWVMHEPSLATSKQQQASAGLAPAATKTKKQGGKQRRLPTDGTNAFASADHYAQDIEQDLATLAADVALSELADDQPPQKHRQKKPQTNRQRRQ